VGKENVKKITKQHKHNTLIC